MDWNKVGVAPVKDTTAKSFLDALLIWIRKPHVANRRLCGAQILWRETVLCHELNARSFVFEFKKTCSKNISEIQFKESTKIDNLAAMLFDGLSEFVKRHSLEGASRKFEVTLRCLIPKKSKHLPRRVLELVVIDQQELQSVFVSLCDIEEKIKDAFSFNLLDERSYEVCLNETEKRLALNVTSQNFQNSETADNQTISASSNCSIPWLSNVLLQKLARWSEEVKLNTEVTSLRLICLQQYNEKYEELKEKYGRHLVETLGAGEITESPSDMIEYLQKFKLLTFIQIRSKSYTGKLLCIGKIWPEQTDAKKFVYEDIGIASYLLILWKAEREAKNLTELQTFVDLGCGNGLLVYLLAAEGHSGVGIDVRKRKIWDLFSDKATLQENAIVPSDSNLFPQCDWLIGNHSDELTPWIPVIAARSHQNCRYFLLPCCPWDFAGKFSGSTLKSAGNSTGHYEKYLDFVCDIGHVCGFHVERDVLRIPSTRRVCFVGQSRSVSSCDVEKNDEKIREYISERCARVGSNKRKMDDEMLEEKLEDDDCHHDEVNDLLGTSVSKSWAEGFKPRSRIEKVRNGVSVDDATKDRINLSVFNKLLQCENRLQLPDGRSWNRGGVLPLKEISEMFDKSVLEKLKSECGGLQTLLKNCPDVFFVREGKVELRDWTSAEYTEYQISRVKKRGKGKASNSSRKKTKLCFYYTHHPDSCALDTRTCRFAHGMADLITNMGDLITDS